MPTTPRRPRLTVTEFFGERAPGLCRCGCGKPCTGRRKVWASDECCTAGIERYQIARGYTWAIRQAVAKRDAGVCAVCGIDTELERVRAAAGTFPGSTPAERAYCARWMRLGFPSPQAKRRPWWNADHITPLAEGGRNVIENFRTLCLRCHATATRRLAARLAAARREAKRPLRATA